MENLLYFEELDSTQTYLKQQAATLPHATVVCAERQTAGRGRYDRKWISRPGGLYFSVLVKPVKTDFLPNLTQLMALSVCHALEDLDLTPTLKWPNDVQINGQKICGILSEAMFAKNKSCSLVLGVGINISQDGLDQIDQPATSLKEMGATADKLVLLSNVLTYFWNHYETLISCGFEGIRPEYLRRFAALGKEISIRNGTQTILGTAEDISSRGTLLLRSAGQLKEIYIGDVIV